MPKVIFYEPAGKIHSSQWDMLNYPPKGYKFATTASSLDGMVGNSFVFDKLRLRVLDRLMPLNLAKAWLDTVARPVPSDASMIFSYNHPIFRDKPWVVLVEWAHILVGRDLRYLSLFKPIVEKALASDNCKGIITWTEVAMRSILRNFDCSGFTNKLAVIPPGVQSKNFERDYDREKVRLLFVGSPADPEDFVMKGGREVLKVFYRLVAKYKNIELVIRANVPWDYLTHVYHTKHIRIITEHLSEDDMMQLYKNADIFIYPSHKIQCTAVLEAMSYGLPVVTTNIGSTCGEYVQDGVTGLVVDDAKGVPYILGTGILTSETIHRGKLIRDIDKRVVKELTDRVAYLIQKPLLRAYLGKMGKFAVDYGKFSIRHRNLLLKKVLDDALC